MIRKSTVLVFALVVFGCIALGADQSWTGVISDSNCGLKHSKASDEAAACVAKCVSGGASYVLVSGGKLYKLDPQNKISPELAGRAVKVTGNLKGNTITVSSASAESGT